VTESGGVTESKIDPATAARVNELAAGVDKIKQEQLQIFENLFKNQKEALERASGDNKVQEQMKKSDEAIGNIKNQTDQKINEMKAKTDSKMKETTEKVEGQGAKTQDALEKAKGGSLEEMRKKQQDLFNKKQ
jgi:DNA anti-recombination protein RmuC